MKPGFTYTQRELSEIHLAMIYAQDFHHGTAGHNGYMVLDKTARLAGFSLTFDDRLIWPDTVEVEVEESKRAPAGL